MNHKQIMILGIGCTLFTDQGFGVSMIQILGQRYEFPRHVRLVDGGLLGVAMTGTIAEADYLIAIDAIRNNGSPGDFYRLEGDQILERLKGKHHVQHVEFLEALAHCQAFDDPPHAILLGIEPDDTKTVACELSPVLQGKTDEMIHRVLAELDRLAVRYAEKEIIP